ncbi:chemotaxis protein CheW [Oscillochloris sp. ZM17-4]|uniref:chemotaxis protein CheW n=1 Tax=Oscillochloris sp. ZM17-4 TaxID=2866714 RepID=UPI001C72E274|nr:chemotaxis protein CheW [Oscillochloris sp. ZM17-4]MBX0330654.1 chemotaxis protein CheW [Oscillochloris sp. ZM17-4]
MRNTEATTAGIIVTFRIGRQYYALPLDAVSQVVRLPDLTDIAGATATLAGMLNLRGAFLPVIDGHALMGVTSDYALDSSILVVALDGAPALGLLADEVDAVERIPAAGVSELTSSAPFVSGIMRDGERTVIMLDPGALHLTIADGR